MVLKLLSGSNIYKSLDLKKWINFTMRLNQTFSSLQHSGAPPKVKWCWSPISDHCKYYKKSRNVFSLQEHSIQFLFFSSAQKIWEKVNNNFSLSFNLHANLHNENSVSYFLLYVYYFIYLVPLIINLIKHTSPLLGCRNKMLAFMYCSGTCHQAKLTDVPMNTQRLVHF